MIFAPRTSVLIIGGSAEARQLARALQGRASVMLPGPERVPQVWPVPVSPLYLDADTLAARLGYGVRCLVDASHPGDWHSARVVTEVAARVGVPVLRLERPPWVSTRRDDWHFPKDERAVARLIGPGKRVLLATGRETLGKFVNLRRCYVYSRQISEHDAVFPLPRGRFLRGAAPFTLAEECALMRRLGIDWLVLRNAGGPGGWPKLAAARRLGLPVAMLSRPDLPKVPTVQSVGAAVQKVAEWLE